MNKALLLVLIGGLLMLDPRCRGGCGTLATHLLHHGLRTI